jgi:uncharacterized protein DUF6600
MALCMRRAIFALLVALGLGAGLQVAAPALAEDQVDIGVFYDSLAPYGHWFQDPRFGWAWQPTAVEPGWRPYTHGHWLWTDEYGWYWNSDYDWGWAPFHYGRWAFTDTYGWIWVPGQVWGPAWVAWRSGDGYVGWAPMPPEAAWRGDGGFAGSSFSVNFAPAWTFCEERCLADPRPVFVPVERNETFIRQTTNVTNYVIVNNRIVDRSVDVHRVEDAAHIRITPVHVRDVDRPELNGRGQAANGEVHVFRPRVAAKSQGQQQPGTQEPARVPEPVMRNPQNLETQKQQLEIEQQKQQRAVEQQKQQRAVEEQKQQREQQRAVEQQKQQRAIEQQKQQHQPQPTGHQEEQTTKQHLRRQQQCQENPGSC